MSEKPAYRLSAHRVGPWWLCLRCWLNKDERRQARKSDYDLGYEHGVEDRGAPMLTPEEIADYADEYTRGYADGLNQNANSGES